MSKLQKMDTRARRAVSKIAPMFQAIEYTKNNGKEICWEKMLKGMIKDCTDGSKNVKYRNIITSVMDKNLKEREFEINELSSQITASHKDLFVYSGWSGNISIFEISEKPLRLKNKLQLHKNQIYGMRFSSDGKYLISSSIDKSIVLWEVTHDYNWKPNIIVLEGEDKYELLHIYSHLVDANFEKKIFVFKTPKGWNGDYLIVDFQNLEHPKVIQRITPTYNRREIKLSPNGKYFFEVESHRINLYGWGEDLETKKIQFLMKQNIDKSDHSEFSEIFFSENCQYFFIGYKIDKIDIYEENKETKQFEFSQAIQHGNDISKFIFSEDMEKMVISLRSDSKIISMVKENEEFKVDKEIEYSGEVNSFGITSDSRFLYVSNDGEKIVKVFETENEKPKKKDIKEEIRGKEKDSLLDNQRRSLGEETIQQDNQDLDINKDPMKIIINDFGQISRMILSQNQQFLAVSNKDRHKYALLKKEEKTGMFRIISKLEFEEKELGDNPKLPIALSHDGKYFLMVINQIIRVWVYDDKEIQPKYTQLEDLKEESEIQEAYFFHMSYDFYTGSEDKNARIWKFLKAEKGKKESFTISQTLFGHEDWVKSITSSEDHSLLATGSHDKSIRIYKKVNEKYELIQSMKDIFGEGIISLIFNRDKRMLLAGSRTGGIKVFIKKIDSEKYTEVQHHENVTSFPYYFFISDDQKLFCSLSQWGAELMLWQIHSSGIVKLYDLERAANCILTNNFEQYFYYDGSWGQIDIKNLKSKLTYDNSFKGNKRLLKLFKDDKYFMNKEVFEGYVNELKEEVGLMDIPENDKRKKEEVVVKKLSYFEAMKIHSRTNIVLMAMLTRFPRLISSCLNTFGYQPFFYKKGFDPIDAAVEIDYGGTLDILSDYFEKNPDDIQIYLNHPRLIKTLRTSSERFKQFIISKFIADPLMTNVEKIYEFPLDYKKGYKTVRCSSHYFELNLRKKIESQAIKYIKKGIDPVKVRYLTTRVPINFSIFYESNRELLMVMKKLSDEIITGDVRYIIKHIWSRNFWKIVIFTILNWACFLMFTYQVVWDEKSIALTIGSVFLSILFFIFEILVAIRDFNNWYHDFYNWLDIYQFISIPLLSILSYSGETNTRSINAWVNLTILLSGYRSLSGLRVLDSVRYMISMILQVFIDMVGFAIILFASMAFFAAVGINLEKLNEGQTPNFTFSGYLEKLNYYYNVSFGGWDPIVGYTTPQTVVYLLSSVFLALVMLNLLIAIISETYTNFEGKKELVDLREMIDILLDYGHFFSYLRGFNCMKKRDKKGRVLICIMVKKDSSTDEVIQTILDTREKIDSNFENLTLTLNEETLKLKSEIEKVKQYNSNSEHQLNIMGKEIEEIKKMNKEIIDFLKNSKDKTTSGENETKS